MDLQIMSDLHLEMHRDKGREFLTKLVPKAPILVLAGDVTMGAYAANFRNTFGPLARKFKAIVYVTGNHEYYNSDPEEVGANLAILRKEFPTVHLLDKEIVTVEGQRFIGGTMWFKRKEKAAPFKAYMNDFHIIENFEPWVYDENKRWTDFVSKNLQPDDVVVTHHLPAQMSIGQQYRGSPLNSFFLCDMEYLIATVQPRLWIHGHTHVRCDYKIGKTRIVANPHGYPNEGESLRRFDEGLVISTS